MDVSSFILVFNRVFSLFVSFKSLQFFDCFNDFLKLWVYRGFNFRNMGRGFAFGTFVGGVSFNSRCGGVSFNSRCGGISFSSRRGGGYFQ